MDTQMSFDPTRPTPEAAARAAVPDGAHDAGHNAGHNAGHDDCQSDGRSDGHAAGHRAANHPAHHATYNPTYDPLVSPPGQGQDYAPTYWVATAGAPLEDDGPIQGDVDADVVIVGSGFTGLSAALTLARDFGVRALVLEANRAVWGCTSRNGGQGQNASGRLYRSQWI
ncbi:MAG: FAD-dependent oxidoreductase, partial [Achromobacter spanius]